MANYSDAYTDKKLAEMESKIAQIYADVEADLREKSEAYFASFAVRYEEEYEKYLAGYYTDTQFKSWWMAQVGRGERWKQLQTNMAQKMTGANIEAARYVNGMTPDIFSLNLNYAAYEIEKGSGIAFDLVSDQTVRALLEGENHTEFRTLSVNPQRDYKWNTQKIQSSLLSGILQGEGADKLATRFLDVMEMNRSAALRNARTAVTSAQNGGRQTTFNRAQEMGIELEKEWVATADSRTRDSHARLDGVRVKNQDPFPNGCMYPGDRGGDPGEVYNCRCAMRAILPKYNGKARKTAINDGKNSQASYVAWVHEKQKFTKMQEDDSIIAGAISGARNPMGKKAKTHAEKYYGLVRSMKTDVLKIAQSTGWSVEDIQGIKKYVFLDEHDLGRQKRERFDPDFMMAESWRRLISGKYEPHDLLMLQHERYEMELVSQGMSQSDAHIIASRKHNYNQEATSYYAKIKKFKD